MLVQNAMRSPFLLPRRAHRKQSGRFVNDDNSIIEVNDPESMQRDLGVGSSLPGRDSYEVSRLQLRIVPDISPMLHSNRTKTQHLFCFCARQPHRRPHQKAQKLASRLDAKLPLRRQFKK
jgi:hypothetical protein